MGILWLKCYQPSWLILDNQANKTLKSLLKIPKDFNMILYFTNT